MVITDIINLALLAIRTVFFIYLVIKATRYLHIKSIAIQYDDLISTVDESVESILLYDQDRTLSSIIDIAQKNVVAKYGPNAASRLDILILVRSRLYQVGLEDPDNKSVASIRKAHEDFVEAKKEEQQKILESQKKKIEEKLQVDDDVYAEIDEETISKYNL